MKILHIIGGSFEDGTLKGACNLHNKSKEFGVKSKILNNDIKNIIYIKKRHKIGKYYSAFLSLFIYKEIKNLKKGFNKYNSDLFELKRIQV